MHCNLIIAGVGGQGNVLASQIVGRAAARTGFKVTIGETFGLSQRGGPVMSHVRLSSENHSGPLIPPNSADVIVGLEPLETMRILAEYGHEETVLLVNSRPIYPLNVIAGEVEYPGPEKMRAVLGESGGALHWFDGTSLAVELGAPILLNMIMLGALSGLPKFPLETEDLKSAVKESFPESKWAVNFKALDAGRGVIGRNEN